MVHNGENSPKKRKKILLFYQNNVPTTVIYIFLLLITTNLRSYAEVFIKDKYRLWSSNQERKTLELLAETCR